MSPGESFIQEAHESIPTEKRRSEYIQSTLYVIAPNHLFLDSPEIRDRFVQMVTTGSNPLLYAIDQTGAIFMEEHGGRQGASLRSLVERITYSRGRVAFDLGIHREVIQKLSSSLEAVKVIDSLDKHHIIERDPYGYLPTLEQHLIASKQYRPFYGDSTGFTYQSSPEWMKTVEKHADRFDYLMEYTNLYRTHQLDEAHFAEYLDTPSAIRTGSL